MELLKLLYKKHKLWIKYLRSIGCPGAVCEDIVQEMYIKIDAYIKKTGNDIMYSDNQVNIYFVYLTLARMYYDYAKKLKKYEVVELKDWMMDDILSEEDIIEEIFEEKIENIYDKCQTIEEWYNDDLYLNLLDETEIETQNYNKEDLEKYYLRRIFKEVFYDKTALSKLSKETKITYWSLRNTVNIIKKQINKIYETRRHISDNI